jgi:hypothetical protein
VHTPFVVDSVLRLTDLLCLLYFPYKLITCFQPYQLRINPRENAPLLSKYTVLLVWYQYSGWRSQTC